MGPVDTFVVESALKNGWIDAAAAAQVRRQHAELARTGRPVDVAALVRRLVPPERGPDVDKLQRLAERMARGGDAKATPTGRPRPPQEAGPLLPGAPSPITGGTTRGQLLDSLARSQGDVVIDLTAPGGANQGPGQTVADEPASGGTTRGRMLDSLAASQGDVVIDLGRPAPRVDLSEAGEVTRETALADLARSQGDVVIDLGRSAEAPSSVDLRRAAPATRADLIGGLSSARGDVVLDLGPATPRPPERPLVQSQPSFDAAPPPRPAVPPRPLVLSQPSYDGAAPAPLLEVPPSLEPRPPAPLAIPPSYEFGSSPGRRPTALPATADLPQPEPARPRPPTGKLERIGPYVIEGELARGGMGVVYVGRHPELDRRVAVKVLLAGSKATPHQVERFQIEARAAARLRHPNIVGIHDVGEDPAGHYFAMDLIEGRSLHDRIRQAPLEGKEAADITRKLALALYYAHGQAILHRDIKPANVLLTKQGEPVLTDFGLAKDTRQEKGVTVDGSFLGTPAYMSPEQAGGEVDLIDRRSDVYSLGATLFEALTGRPPFQADNPMQLVALVITKDPPAPSSLVRGLDRDLETICLTCMHKEPERRYGSMKALADDLQRFLDDRPILARPPSALDLVRRWARRHRAIVAVSGVAVALILGVALFAGVERAKQTAVAAEREKMAREQARDEARTELVRVAREAARKAAAEASKASLPKDLDAREPPARQRLLEEHVARALAAATAAQRWHATAGDEPEAAGAHVEALLGLATATARAEQWVLAAQAVTEAEGVAKGLAQPLRDRVTKARAAVEAERTARGRARLEEVQAALAGVEQGQVEPDDALFRIVRLADEHTAGALVAAVDATARALRDARRTFWQRAEAPGAGDAGGTIDGLAAALDALDALPVDGALSPGHQVALQQAAQRVEQRAIRSLPAVSRDFAVERPRAAVLLANEQEAALGRRAVVARVACEALGRLGIRGAPVAALGRYLAAESSPLRAAPAAIALCRLGGEEALRLAGASVRRFDSTNYRQQVRQALVRAQGGAAPEPEPEPTPVAATERPATERPATERPATERPGGGDAELDRVETLLAAKKLDEARRTLDRRLAANPKDAKALHLRAHCRAEQGDAAGALADHDATISADPGETDALTCRARLRAKSDPRGARADLDAALARRPDDPRALVVRAQLLTDQLQDHAAAVADATKAIERDPESGIAWHVRGVANGRAGKHDASAADLQRSTELDPGMEAPNALFRAQTNLGRGRPDLALADLSRVIELEPRNGHAYSMRAQVHMSLGDAAAGGRDLDRTIELLPDDAVPRGNRGALRANKGDLKGALEDLDEALAMAPHHEQLWFLRGMVHLNGKDEAAALRDFEECTRRPRPVPEAFCWKGMLEAKRGRTAEARAALERYLQLEPDGREARNAREALARLAGR